MLQSEITRRTQEMYDGSAQAYKENYTDVSQSAEDFIKYVPKGGKILEVGCGVGVDANFFGQSGRIVVATDISPQMIAQAQQDYADTNIDFRVADINNLEISDNEFDGLFAESCLRYVIKAEVPNVLRRFHRILKVGGTLGLGLQEGESQEVFLPEPFPPYKEALVDVFSYTEARGLLKAAGFSPLMSWSTLPKDGQHPFRKLKIFARKNA